jgi:ribosomal-protein-alanine N-acetyltransferase
VIELVPMTEAHLSQVMEHEKETFGSEAWSRSSYLAELRDRRTRHYVVAVEDGILLGWAGQMIVADTTQIMTVGTVAAARRRGVGRQLVQALLTEAAARGVTEVILEVRVDNEAAQKLYDSFGFTPLRIRHGYYDGGRVDAIEMRLALP